MATTVAVVQVAINTASGTQDITTTKLGGLTPKAALFILGGGITNDVAADHGRLSYGATDGAFEWYIQGRSEHGVGTTNVVRGAHTTGLIGLLDTNLKDKEFEASFDSFLVNGIRIDWTTAPPSAHQMTVIFFAGDDLEVDAGIVKPLLQDAVIDNTQPGFEPDGVFFGYCHNNFDGGMDDGVKNHIKNAFGFALNDGNTIADAADWAFCDRNGEPSTDVTTSVSDEHPLHKVREGAFTSSIEVREFDADGFSVVARENDVNREIGYLAIKTPTNTLGVGIYDTPTSTGNDSKTGIGFEPQAVVLGLTFFDGALTDPESVETNDFSYGVSAFDATDAASVSAQVQDAVGTSDTQSISDDIVANLPNDNGSTGFEATFVTMDSDGWTLNFSNAVGSSKKWWFFAIGVAPAQGQVSHAQFDLLDIPRGQVSQTEFEVPSLTVGEVSQAEFEVPHPPTKGQLSFTEFQIPTQLVESRSNVTFSEFEVPDFEGFSAGQLGFVQLEIPDFLDPDRPALVSLAEFIIPNVNAGGTQGAAQLPFAEFEVPDAKSIQITELHLETEDPRRRGRVSFARVEFASVAGQNRQAKIVLQNINRELFLEELDVYGIKPDIGFFLPGFNPIGQEFPEQNDEQSDVDPQRIWTPKQEISIQFGEPVQRGEMWLEYSFVLTEEDLFHILLVCNQHDPLKTTAGQDTEDQFFEDLAVLRDYSLRCGPTGSPQLTAAEKDDCHCRLLRVVLRLSTETTIRRIQEDPFTDEPFDLDLSSLI